MNKIFLQITLLSIITQLLQAGDWPNWRGTNRDDVSDEKGLLETWPTGGPKKLWMARDGGLGYAGFSVGFNSITGTCQ